VPGDQKIVGLHTVHNSDVNHLAFIVSGNYTVDWGDGVIEYFSAGDQAQHIYNYSTLAAEVTSQGYKTAIVQITRQAGYNLTSVNFNVKHTGLTGGGGRATSGWLDLAINGSFLTTIALRYYPINFSNLEMFVLKENGFNNSTDITYFFQCEGAGNTNGLRHAEVYIPPTVTNLALFFVSCPKLNYVRMTGMRGVTNMGSFLSGSLWLEAVDFEYTGSVITWQEAFSGCANLKKIIGLDMSAAIQCGMMFQSCSSLEEAYFYNTGNVSNIYYMFNACAALKTVYFSNLDKLTTLQGAFYQCSSLQEVNLPALPICSDFYMAFMDCYSLRSVKIEGTPAPTGDVQSMFSGCYCLEEVPDRWDGTNQALANSIFQNCYGLKKLPDSWVWGGNSAIQSFSSAMALREIPAWDFSKCNDLGSWLGTNFNLTRVKATGIKVSFSVENNQLSATALNELYTNLATVTDKTITASGNLGYDASNKTIATAKGWTVN